MNDQQLKLHMQEFRSYKEETDRRLAALEEKAAKEVTMASSDEAAKAKAR